MPSDRLTDYWRKAGELLDFVVEAPCQVVLADGRSFIFSACLPQFGAERGMLLSNDYELFESATSDLVAAGYGYSILDAPHEEPNRSDVIDLLQDWGWSASSLAPEWLRL